MARPHKKHHKIPSTYLEGFVDKLGKLWVSDRVPKVYSQSPSELLTENDYYTIRFPSGGGTLEIETKYLGGIEGSYASVYHDKVVKKLPITDRDKAVLAIFVASMMERQPMSRQSLKRFFNDIREKVEHMRQVPKEQLRRFSEMSPRTQGPSVSADELLKVAEDVGSFHTSMIPDTVSGIAPIIHNMHWVFGVRQDGSLPFLTSDNPCVMVNAIAENIWGRGTMGALPGLAQDDVDLTLPLSSDIVLICGWHYRGDCDYLPIPKDLVDEINRRTSRHADIIISSDKAMLEEIAERIKKKKSSTGLM